MSELKPVTPLLDAMIVQECFSNRGSTACYHAVHRETGKRFVLKHIRIPESEERTLALILTGAVTDETGAQDYYEQVANSIRREVTKLSSLSGHSCMAAWSGYQVEPREDVGYDVYLLMPYQRTLQDILVTNAMTQLQALNFGIDLCNALDILREAGYVYLNLKPENILVDDNGHHMIGDLGLMPLEELSYCAVPEGYLNDFTAPELMQLFAVPDLTSDIYSLGLILYYIFNGSRLPFDDGEQKPEKIRQMRLQGKTLPMPVYADRELSEIIARACDPDPRKRWATPAELRQALILYMRRNVVSDQPLVPPSAEEAEQLPTEEAVLTPELPAEAAQEIPVELPTDEVLVGRLPEEEVPAMQVPQEEMAVPEDAAAEMPEEDPAMEFVHDPVENEELRAAVALEETPAPAAFSYEETGEASELDQFAASLNDVAEEDLSIDAFLASVNDVLEESEPEPVADAPDFEANEAAQKEQQPKESKKKIWLPLAIVILALSLLVAAIIYFYSNWYLVTMDAISVAERTDTTITVSYVLSTPDPELSWECIDTYGNSFPGVAGEGSVTFQDLTPGMQYTINFFPGKLHKLLGGTSISAATATQTQIVSMSAAPGGNSTTAEVSIVVSGPEPEKWMLTYSSSNSDSGSVTFSGHSILIPGLNLHDSYTFELHTPDGFYLAGQTSCELSMTANVQARDLQVTAATGDSLSVTWESLADAPQFWTVTCVGDNYNQTLDVTECAATFTGTNLNTAYTFMVTADGLSVPLSVSLPANATVITSLKAEAVDAGSIEVTWANSEPQPEGGWVVRYLVGGDENLSGSAAVTEGTTAVLRGLPPKSEVVVMLQAANGAAIIGTQSLTVMMPEATAFAEHDFTSSESKLTTYVVPDMEDWGIDDLDNEEEVFGRGSVVAVVLQAPDGFNGRDQDETPITLVLRDESGKVVYYKAVSCTWDDIWNDGRYLTSFSPPETPGKYQIELYFNNQTVNSCVITVPDEDAPEDAQTTEE